MISNLKAKILLPPLVFISLLFAQNCRSFTVSASVTKSKIFEFPADEIVSLIEDLSVFSRNFPNMISVTSLGGNKSEWVYEINPPMASRFSVSFLLYKKTSDNELVVFESSKNDDNYFYCKAKFVPSGEERTVVSLNFRIKLVRENGSDIHYLAPLLGEKYISNKMRNDLSEDTDVFINRVIKELKKRHGK